MTRRPRRTSLLAGLGVGVVLLLSACGGASAAGSAAVLGDSSVTTEQVAAQVAAVHRANDEPVDQVDEDLTRQTVERLTTEDLVNQAAERLGVTVDPGEIDTRLGLYDDQLGGRENVEKAFLQNGVPPEAVRDTIALSLKAEAMGPVLVPAGAPEEQQQAVYEYIVELSDELGVTVSPRFGTWDATQLAVGPRPTDLAVPVFDALLEEGIDPGASAEPAASPSAS
jgi:hypothetical protein